MKAVEVHLLLVLEASPEERATFAQRAVTPLEPARAPWSAARAAHEAVTTALGAEPPAQVWLLAGFEVHEAMDLPRELRG